MNEHLLKSLESSVNKMGVALRIQFERWTEITDKFKIDKNDAITNFEHSFDGVLETVHSVDDNLRKLKLVEKQNTVLRFLNLIRNIRHHDSSKLPFSLTKNILMGEWAGEWFKHGLNINGEEANLPMIVPLEITQFVKTFNGFIESGRSKQEHLDQIISELFLENFYKNQKSETIPTVLDINPIIVVSCNYLFRTIKENNLNLKILEDAETYFDLFSSMKDVRLTKPKIDMLKKLIN